MAEATVQQAMQIAIERQRAGRLAEAEALYRQTLQRESNHAGALHRLGLLLGRRGQLQQAVELIRRAIRNNPDDPEAQNNLGVMLADLGRFDEAIESYHRAIQLKPDDAVAYGNLGNALLRKRRVEEALTAYQTALRLDPLAAEAHFNLGNGLREQDRIDEAIAAFRHAILLNPNHSNAYNNLGAVLMKTTRFKEAGAAFASAVKIQPDHATAHWNHGVNLLLRGDLEAGWKEYEWRWKCDTFPTRPRVFRQDQWRGEDPRGKTILLHPEQGFGDNLQFIRYASLLANRGARVLLTCPPALLRLFETMKGIAQNIGVNQPLPDFDLHCPLLSLPVQFGTTLATIPAEIPYLWPHADLVNAWLARLPAPPDDRRKRVGLVWTGRAQPSPDRSIPAAELTPLARVADVQFISLQKPPAQRPALDLADPMEQVDDFADTAAVISRLDLVISIDTAVAHLAGAMGKPVWTLLPLVPDWRWMLDRPDSPWYPTMRLFRQNRPGDWASVIRSVAEELAKWSSQSLGRSKWRSNP